MPIYHVGTYSKLDHERYRSWLRSIRRIVLIFLATIAACTVGLLLLDSTEATMQQRLLHALWNAANTISTLGSLSQLNDAQRVFMIVAMLTLVGTGGYAVTSLAGALSSPDVQSYLENMRMEKILSKIEGHIILAGFGTFGQKIAEKLKAAGKTVVVIDRNPDAATAASTLGYLTVQGSISQDGVLDRVRTDTAEAFVVTIPDPDRLLAATLMARNLNPDMRIYVVTDMASPWLSTPVRRRSS